MFSRLPFALKAGAVAAALFLFSSAMPSANAEGRSGGGRGYSGSRGGSSGFRGSFGVSPSYRGGYSGYRGGYSAYRGGYSGYRGGYGGYREGYRGGDYGYRGGYYGYRGGYYGGYSGLGLGIYTTPYLYDYSPTYVYSSPPSVVVTSPSVDTLVTTAPADAVVTTPPPPDTFDATPAPQTPAANDTDNRARVEVLVPADAQVWFNGSLTAQRGEQRDFASPPLTPGRDYTYEIRARWNDNGRVVDQTRAIIVKANARIGVDFGQPESVVAPAPK